MVSRTGEFNKVKAGVGIFTLIGLFIVTYWYLIQALA
jgi:hypothetical protein